MINCPDEILLQEESDVSSGSNLDDSFNGRLSSYYSSSSTSINDIDELANPMNYPTPPTVNQ